MPAAIQTSVLDTLKSAQEASTGNLNVNVAGSTGTITVNSLASGTSTLTNVASSATSVTIASGNSSRTGLFVFNDSTQILYLSLGSSAASTSNYTVQMAPGAYYEIPNPNRYTGKITGIWASANGFARVTELTP